MTSLSVDQNTLDIALGARYAGIQVPIGTPPVMTDVRVFVEKPDNEEVPERVYPSVSITFSAMVPAYPNYDSDDFTEEDVGVDTGPAVPVRHMRRRALPYNVLYLIHTWAKARATTDRELVKKVFIDRTEPRTFLDVDNIDGESIALDMYHQSGMVVRDEDLVDEVIYHKVIPVVVVAHLSPVEAGDVRDELTVTEVRHTFRNYKLLESGEVVDSKIDLSLKIDENGVERL